MPCFTVAPLDDKQPKKKTKCKDKWKKSIDKKKKK